MNKRLNMILRKEDMGAQVKHKPRLAGLGGLCPSPQQVASCQLCPRSRKGGEGVREDGTLIMMHVALVFDISGKPRFWQGKKEGGFFLSIK